jgi:hypothetical protein
LGYGVQGALRNSQTRLQQEYEVDRPFVKAYEECEGRILQGKKFAEKEVHKKTKIAIYITTLTYRCESWTLWDTHRSKTQASEMRFLRRVEKVTKRDRIRNQVIREQLQVEPLQECIERTTAGGTITGAY